MIKIAAKTIAGIVLMFLLVNIADTFAVPRNPPPVFETEYALPITQQPQPNNPLAAENFIAVAFYSLMILVAALAVHRLRSRRLLFALSIVSLAYFGFFREGCPCPVGMFQNIIDALVAPTAIISWTVILLFVIPLFAALFWGRVFCSSVCPFGAVQELTLIKNVPIPDNVEQGLGLLRYLYLGFGVCCVFVGLGYYVCRFDPYVGFFRFGGLLPVMIFSVGVLMTGFFIARPFCRFLCPYGALLGLCGSVAAKKVSVTPGDCTKCNLCANVCPYNAILPPTVLPDQIERRQGPQRLAAAIVTLPVLMLLLGFLGYKAVPKFAPLHPNVRTAELLYAEEQKLVNISGSFPETHAVLQSGGSNSDAYSEALETVRRFRVAGLGFGLWCGFVIGVKLIVLSIRRKRTQYEVDPARCFACGHCFWYCPNQQGERVLLTQNKPEPQS